MTNITVHMTKDATRKLQHFPANKDCPEFWSLDINDGAGNCVTLVFQDIESFTQLTGGTNV